MRRRAVFPGRYVQGRRALEHLNVELESLGTRLLLVAGRTATDSLLPAYLENWEEQFSLKVENFGGECSEQEIARLTKVANDHGSHVVIGVGGGKVIDTAKAVGHRVNARVAIVPTIASTDAPTSAVSVIYTDEGTFDHYIFHPRNPDLVLVDTQVIANAPVRFLVAGIGDALATWLEADACRQSYSNNQCGGLGTLAGFQLARLCYDTVLKYGFSATLSCQQNVVTPALSHVVEANTLLSGLGFECGGLAAAHSIHNGLTQLEGTHAYYHGEKVAMGVLAGLFLANRPTTLIEEIYAFCKSVGLPTTLADIGIGQATNDDLWEVARAACAEEETIHHEPAPVSPESVRAALVTADQFGRRRRSRR